MSELEDVVRYECVGDQIAVVTLNRPQARNAINGDVARAIDAIRTKIEADPRFASRFSPAPALMSSAREQI